MSNTIKVDIVDTEKRIFCKEVSYLIVPAILGEMGIYPNHIPIITKLKAGVLRLHLPNEDREEIFAISGGFLEINKNVVTVLADIVERSTQLDEMRLLEQKKEAENRLKLQSNQSSTLDVAKAQASLEILIAQLKTIDYIKTISKYNNKKF